MKYILSFLLLGIVTFLQISNSVFSVGVYVDDDNRNMLLDPMKSSGRGGTENIATVGTGMGQKDGLLQVVKNAINWVLGLLALIALIILLRGGFQMVTAAGDDKKYETGMTYLKQAAGGLIMIGVAWFLVSIIFYVINLVTK